MLHFFVIANENIYSTAQQHSTTYLRVVVAVASWWWWWWWCNRRLAMHLCNLADARFLILFLLHGLHNLCEPAIPLHVPAQSLRMYKMNRSLISNVVDVVVDKAVDVETILFFIIKPKPNILMCDYILMTNNLIKGFAQVSLFCS